MKKFLALLFVCAGLTAMAAPHVNKADLTQVNKGQMVMKANTLTNQLTVGVSKTFMEAAKKNVQRNHADQVLNRAPKRLSDEEIINMPYVCFLYKAQYDDNGEYVESDPFYAGSGAYWYPDTSEGLYFAGFYWDEEGSTYYLPIDVDYNTGEVALPWGLLLVNDTVSSGSGRTRTDTIRWHALFSEAYFMDGDTTDCMGTMYADGSIIFDDNYVYYREEVINKYNNGRLASTDTTLNYDVFLHTEILAANGKLSYVREQNNQAAESYVYMFQNEPADTLFVGNMWNYGMPNVVLNVGSDGKVNYNCIAEVTEEGTTILDNPIWDIDDTWIEGGLGMCYGFSGYTEDADGYVDEILWGFEADGTPDQLTWDYTGACNGYHLFYGYKNNVLTWINGNQFRFPVPPVPPFIRGDVNNDGAVNISDVATLVDHLLSGDFDDADGFSSDAADCDEDGGINISDVATLVDYLLVGEW